MGFWRLLEVASMPIMEVLIVSGIGGFMATDFFNLLSSDTCKSLNKIVFVVFTPSLIFASLVKTVTFEDIISWWFMPVNIGITFLCGGILGWAAIKLIKPKPHMEGLIIAMCSTGNFANLLLIMVPAICMDDDSPFGDHSVCKIKGLSYASFSMALGSFYTWTCTYQLIQGSALRYNVMREAEERSKKPNKDLDANKNTCLLNGNDQNHINRNMLSSNRTSEDTENQSILYKGSAGNEEKKDGLFSNKLVEVVKKILEQLLAPPTLGSFAGLVFGAIPWLRNLLIGDNAPLQRWNSTLPHSYTRRQPHTRSSKGKCETHDRHHNHLRALFDSSHDWHRRDQNGYQSWVTSIRSPLQFCVVDHVHSASWCEYKYNDTIV